MSAEQRIREIGLALPSGSAPAANYANAVRTGNLRAELGSLDRVARVVEIQGFLNAVPEFEDHPIVARVPPGSLPRSEYKSKLVDFSGAGGE